MPIPDHVASKLHPSPGSMTEPEIYIWVLAPAGPLSNLATLAKALTHSEPLSSRLRQRPSNVYIAYFMGYIEIM